MRDEIPREPPQLGLYSQRRPVSQFGKRRRPRLGKISDIAPDYVLEARDRTSKP